MAGINQTIAENLRRLLEYRGKTQADLAQYMGVSQATASNWCNGIKVPRMDKIDRMCKFLSCSRSDLMDEHLPPPVISSSIIGALSQEERALILSYRSADPARRGIIREILGIQKCEQ